MKWIGQHIWSFISRFRNDVYLEAVDTSTETDMLVVDSAGKVTKRAIDAITVDVSDFMTNGVDNRVLTATGADAMNAEANFTFDGSLATITGSTKMISDSPLLMHADGNIDDYHRLTVGVNGSIEWSSADAAGANANLAFDIDGYFHVDATAIMFNPIGLLKTTATGVEIENASDSGVTALIINNDDADEKGLYMPGVNTTANSVLIDSVPLTTGKLLYLQHVSLHTTGHDSNLSFVQYTNIGVLASGQTQNIKGHYVALSDLATNHASSTKTMTGIDVDVTYNSAQGTTSATGINLLTTGADTNTGIDMTTADGGTDIILRSSADTGDTCTIATTTHGATTITTVDDNATAAHFEISADGNITLDAAGTISLQTGSNSVAVPDATGTVQLQGSNTGQTFSVQLKVDDIYVLYVSAQNYWYHTAYAGQNFGTSIGSESDSVAMRGVSYLATSACKVNKVTIAFYLTSSADLEFQVTKIPLVDGSNSNVTLAAMTHNDINFSASANYNYVKTMTMTGAGSDNELTAGQAFTLAVRRTDGSGTRVLYGNCFAEIELT